MTQHGAYEKISNPVSLGAGRSIGLSLALVASALIFTATAHGIYNRTSALGSRYVVKIVSAGFTCSGALVSSRIVATAAHCVVRAGKAVTPEQIRVYGAGVDLSTSSEFARVENFVYPSTFRNVTDSPEPNDIAFLVLSKDWGEVAIDGLADFDLTREIIASATPIEIYGYGSLKSQSESSSAPYLFIASVVEQLRYREFVGFERRYINYRLDESGAACPGTPAVLLSLSIKVGCIYSRLIVAEADLVIKNQNQLERPPQRLQVSI